MNWLKQARHGLTCTCSEPILLKDQATEGLDSPESVFLILVQFVSRLLFTLIIKCTYKLYVIWNEKEYSKTCVKWSISKRPQIGVQEQLSLNTCQKCCRMRNLQYFLPSLSYHLSFRSLFCLFLSGRFTKVLLYWGLTRGNDPFRPSFNHSSNGVANSFWFYSKLYEFY